MSTAIEPSPVQKAPLSRTQLLTAGLVGATLTIAGFLAGAFLAQSIPATVPYVELVRLLAFLGGIVAGIVAVSVVSGPNPPKGTRGGIFLVIATAITIYFITRAVGLNFRDASFGPYATVAVLAALLFFAYRFLTSDRAENIMLAVEHQGWFHFNGYKKTQGLHLRRYTMIGVLIIGWSGAWASRQSIGTGDLALSFPFINGSLPLLPDIEITIPLLLAALTFWFAFRLVNVPGFTDFLIATEAEMNKVSWSTRRRLYQDTIVVLITVFVITVFLLIVDVFWGWLLSVKFIGVLPPRQEQKGQQDPTGNKSIAW